MVFTVSLYLITNMSENGRPYSKMVPQPHRETYEQRDAPT
jgi:hypothetical protein